MASDSTHDASVKKMQEEIRGKLRDSIHGIKLQVGTKARRPGFSTLLHNSHDALKAPAKAIRAVDGQL